MQSLRIGSRGSALARAQTRQVAQLLRASDPACEATLVTIRVSGDEDAAGSPAPEDKTRWVDAIEDALLAGDIDLAVHSAKDVPGELANGLELIGCPARAPVEDVLCGASALEDLAAGARVGTSSIRRTAQLHAVREDLQIVAMRGNVDTRLARRGELAAIVLARAGLSRLGREAEIGALLDPVAFVPAPGQGILALEARAGDERVRDAVAAIGEHEVFACLLAERALARGLNAGCDTPLGALARPAGGGLGLRAWVGLPDGSAWVVDELAGELSEPERLGRDVARRMDSAGAGELLARAG